MARPMPVATGHIRDTKALPLAQDFRSREGVFQPPELRSLSPLKSAAFGHAQNYNVPNVAFFPKEVLRWTSHGSNVSLPARAWSATGSARDDAFRFGRGEQLRSSSGQLVRLEHPLDWLVVSNHAEYLGMARAGWAARFFLRPGAPAPTLTLHSNPRRSLPCCDP